MRQRNGRIGKKEFERGYAEYASDSTWENYNQFFLWVAQELNITKEDLPFTLKAIRASKDEHLNDLPLLMWDRCDREIRKRAYERWGSWSLSFTVSTLKVMARHLAAKEVV